MANNNAQIISSIISLVDKRITILEAREKINVSMRIDEIIPFLKDISALAKDDQSSRKFDLILDKTGSATVSYTINGESASAGANVLKFGDKLVITVTAATGYTITKLKVNGKNYTSGTEITVEDDIDVEVVSTLNTYNLTITPAEHTEISVLKGSTPVSAGTGVISYGDSLVISATADEGYTITSLNINGVDYVGDQTVTVTGNITVTTTAIVSAE